MAAFVKVHQNRDLLVRQRTQRGFSTGVRAAKYLVLFNPYPVISKDAGSPEEALQAAHDHWGTLAQGDLTPVLIGPKSCESYYCCLLRQSEVHGYLLVRSHWFLIPYFCQHGSTRSGSRRR